MELAVNNTGSTSSTETSTPATIITTAEHIRRISDYANLNEFIDDSLRAWASRQYASSGNQPTESQIVARRQLLVEKLGEAAQARSRTERKIEDRKTLSAAITQRAQEMNISFIHLRMVQATVEDPYELTRDELLDWVTGIDETPKNMTAGYARSISDEGGIQYIPRSNGGMTIAYELSIGTNNRVLMTFALARCNAADVFDRLEGRRIALIAFEADRTLEVQLTHLPIDSIDLDEHIQDYLVAYPGIGTAKASSVKITKDLS